SAHRARVSDHGHARVGALSLRIFSFAGFRDRALLDDRLCSAAGRADPILSRIVTRRCLAARAYGMQAPRAGVAAHHLTVSFISASKHRISISDRATSLDGWRFFGSTFPG